jgi:hypothetical protein
MITKYALFAVLGLAVVDMALRLTGFGTADIYGPVLPWYMDGAGR